MPAPSPPPASVTPASPAPPTPPRRPSALLWLLALIALAAATWFGWHRWQSRQAERFAAASSQQLRLDAMEHRLDALRRGQHAQASRLQQAEATNRVLRDELLGISQRAALLEDSLDKLAATERSGAQAMRLDEVEWLLVQGLQRLQLAGDLDGARHAYALASQGLDGIADPAFLDLRQVLAQERAALDALGADPKTLAARRLDAFATQLTALPVQPESDPRADGQTWWQRVLGRIVSVRHAESQISIDPGDRAAAFAALQLELSLARASAERRDTAGYQAALSRADDWLQRLWPPSQTLTRQRKRLHALRVLPLAIEMPTLGSTLAQLGRQRQTR